MFPRLLSLPSLHTSATLQAAFNEAAERVPEWMFVGWIPQIMSVFSFDNECFLDALLLRMARANPLAVCYPFRLSYERRNEARTYAANADAEDDRKDRTVVLRLLRLLHSPATEAFAQALLCLCVPEKKLSHHLRELYMELDRHDDETDRRYLRARVRCLVDKMWPQRQTRGRAYQRLERYRLQMLEMQTEESEYFECRE